MIQDYYKILNIPRNSSQENIRAAFIKKAKQYHPDVNKQIGAKNDFQLINEAYQTLIDKEKRKWYDFKLNYPSTTGLSDTNRSTTRNNEHKYASYYRAYQRRQQAEQQGREEAKYTKTLLDKVLFYFLVVVGVFAFLFGSIRLVFEKWEGLNDLSGVVFGIWFVLLLLYGWNKLSK